MLSPEVIRSPSGSSGWRRRIRRVDPSKKKSDHASPCCADTVRIVLPGHLHCPQPLREAAVSSSCPSYTASGVRTSDLASQAFVKAFVVGGRLTLRATGRTRTRTTLWVTPSGAVWIFDGDADCARRRKTRPEAQILCQDLPSLSSSPSALSSLCRRLRTAFGGGDADAAFVWRPGDADVCPSSLAKFFHDLGAEVRESDPEEETKRSRCVRVPSPWTEGEAPTWSSESLSDVVDTLEDFSGACALGFDKGCGMLEEGDGDVTIATFRCFYDADWLEDIRKAFFLSSSPPSGAPWSLLSFGSLGPSPFYSRWWQASGGDKGYQRIPVGWRSRRTWFRLDGTTTTTSTPATSSSSSLESDTCCTIAQV